MAVILRTFVVTGRVQGVGYRYFAQKAALALNLRGWVRNLPSGSVECLAAGSAAALAQFEDRLRQGPVLARVDFIESTDSHGVSIEGFHIR